jgi:hypothetical protein
MSYDTQTGTVSCRDDTTGKGFSNFHDRLSIHLYRRTDPLNAGAHSAPSQSFVSYIDSRSIRRVPSVADPGTDIATTPPGIWVGLAPDVA